MVDEIEENFPREEDLKTIAARYLDLPEYECAGYMVHSYRRRESSPTTIQKILKLLFKRIPTIEIYRISFWINGKFQSCTDVYPEVWKYGNWNETPELFRARIISNLVKVAEKRGNNNGQEKNA